MAKKRGKKDFCRKRRRWVSSGKLGEELRVTVVRFKGSGHTLKRQEEGGGGRLKTRNETENGSNHKSIIYRVVFSVLLREKKRKCAPLD